MRIKSKKELKFYMMADLMMNRGKFKRPFLETIYRCFFPDYIMSYLRALRKCSYYEGQSSFIGKMHFWYNRFALRRLGLKLGFSIWWDALGYGVVIPHYGTIVVGGEGNCVGNYPVLHTSTCISGNGKIIGDALYLATGAKMTSTIKLGNGISVGANSVVNKSFDKDNIMIAGMPAKEIKFSEPWYIRDGNEYYMKWKSVEDLRNTMNI